MKLEETLFSVPLPTGGQGKVAVSGEAALSFLSRSCFFGAQLKASPLLMKSLLKI